MHWPQPHRARAAARRIQKDALNITVRRARGICLQKVLAASFHAACCSDLGIALETLQPFSTAIQSYNSARIAHQSCKIAPVGHTAAQISNAYFLCRENFNSTVLVLSGQMKHLFCTLTIPILSFEPDTARNSIECTFLASCCSLEGVAFQSHKLSRDTLQLVDKNLGRTAGSEDH